MRYVSKVASSQTVRKNNPWIEIIIWIESWDAWRFPPLIQIGARCPEVWKWAWFQLLLFKIFTQPLPFLYACNTMNDLEGRLPRSVHAVPVWTTITYTLSFCSNSSHCFRLVFCTCFGTMCCPLAPYVDCLVPLLLWKHTGLLIWSDNTMYKQVLLKHTPAFPHLNVFYSV